MKPISPSVETRFPGRPSSDTDAILKTIFQIFPDLLFYLDEHGVIINYLASESVNFFTRPEYCLGRHVLDIFPPHAAAQVLSAMNKTLQNGEISTIDYDVSYNPQRLSYSISCLKIKTSNLILIVRDTTEQKRKADSAEQHRKLMGTLQESARQLSRELDSQVLGNVITQACIEHLGASEVWLGWLKIGQGMQELGFLSTGSTETGLSKPNNDEINTLLVNKIALLATNDPGSNGPQHSRALFPILANNQVMGVLGLVVEQANFFTPEMIDYFFAYNALVGSAIQNAHLYEDSRRQLSQMQTLRSIDQAILSSMDMKSMTEVILKEVAKHIHVDALSLLILDPKTQMLNFVDGFGFHFETLRHSHLRIGESFAGQVALEKRIVYVENLQSDPKNFSRAARFHEEGFMMYLGTPLIARSEVRGVLEIFQRRPFEPDEEWYTILETLSNQIAIAIDNTLLVKFLKDSRLELTNAYDATIEGLSRALELRDRETEGHTRRVAKMTVELARRMGVSDADMPLVHQGALLHDIGKMGIPDAILLKPGALLPDEWEIMKQHPLYAYQLLAQVKHLKQAMDIPLYHHEKWDGTGYPYGLKGEQIPFPARLFSIVDVYDALTSNRPYRSAWPVDKTMTYLQSQSKIFFDPDVVPVFRQLILRDTIPMRRDARSHSKTTPIQQLFK
jgi:putative nucleotidyltransferase with HDIG domain